jgi:hypothetical protein
MSYFTTPLPAKKEAPIANPSVKLCIVSAIILRYPEIAIGVISFVSFLFPSFFGAV